LPWPWKSFVLPQLICLLSANTFFSFRSFIAEPAPTCFCRIPSFLLLFFFRAPCIVLEPRGFELKKKLFMIGFFFCPVFGALTFEVLKKASGRKTGDPLSYAFPGKKPLQFRWRACGALFYPGLFSPNKPDPGRRVIPQKSKRPLGRTGQDSLPFLCPPPPKFPTGHLFSRGSRFCHPGCFPPSFWPPTYNLCLCLFPSLKSLVQFFFFSNRPWSRPPGGAVLRFPPPFCPSLTECTPFSGL